MSAETATAVDGELFVLPGDAVGQLASQRSTICLGAGLRQQQGEPGVVAASLAGVLHRRAPNLNWLEAAAACEESPGRRYFPRKGDLVVGVAVAKRGDLYCIDVGASELAILSSFAFEGATKKLRVELNVGDAVYARVLAANREMEPELVCVDSYFKAGRLGLLPAADCAHLFEAGQARAQRLLSPRDGTLRRLGAKHCFEVAVGVNGRVWLSARSLDVVHRLQAAILAS